jgi:hypothetical protein
LCSGSPGAKSVGLKFGERDLAIVVVATRSSAWISHQLALQRRLGLVADEALDRARVDLRPNRTARDPRSTGLAAALLHSSAQPQEVRECFGDQT